MPLGLCFERNRGKVKFFWEKKGGKKSLCYYYTLLYYRRRCMKNEGTTERLFFTSIQAVGAAL